MKTLEVFYIDTFGKELSKEEYFMTHIMIFEKAIKKYIYKLLGSTEFRDDEQMALDIVQIVMMVAFRDLEALKEKDMPIKWMYGIAKNKTINQIEKERLLSSRTTSLDDFMSNGVDIGAGDRTVHEVFRRTQLNNIRQVLLQFDLRSRTIFEMRFYHDMKVQEMSKIFGISPNAMRVQICRIKNKVKVILEKMKAKEDED